MGRANHRLVNIVIIIICIVMWPWLNHPPKCCHCGKEVDQNRSLKKIIEYAWREKDLWRAIVFEQECGDIRMWNDCCQPPPSPFNGSHQALLSFNHQLDCLWTITEAQPLFLSIQIYRQQISLDLWHWHCIKDMKLHRYFDLASWNPTWLLYFCILISSGNVLESTVENWLSIDSCQFLCAWHLT